MIRVYVSLQNPQGFLKKLTRLQSATITQMEALGNDTVSTMRNVITAEVKRQPHTGNLAAAINKYSGNAGSQYWVGVGSYDELYEKAKYWAVVNFGGYVPPIPPIGMFAGGGGPDPAKDGERWLPTGEGTYMFPSKPIRPMNYIETTIMQIRGRWSTIFSGNVLLGGLPTPTGQPTGWSALNKSLAGGSMEF